MELDDLKKSWNVLDKQLQKENIVDEKQIAELIAKYQAGAKKGLNSLSGFQKNSLIVAVILILFIAAAILVDTSFLKELKITVKVVAMFFFALITVCAGFWWDMKTYRFARETKVAEMSTVEVIERMNKFKGWTRIEFKIIPFWAIAFFILYYWLRDFHTQPMISQIVFIIGSLVIVCIVMLVLHKMLFKHLNEIDKNLEELKELENDK